MKNRIKKFHKEESTFTSALAAFEKHMFDINTINLT